MTGLSAEEADEQWDLAFESLALGDNPNVPDVLWFSGAAYCDCHSEFVHGAYWVGGLAMSLLGRRSCYERNATRPRRL
jgi:hypothetical protein